MDLVTLMTLKLTAQHRLVQTSLVTAIMKNVAPVRESRRAVMSAITALPKPQKCQLTGMVGCIIPRCSPPPEGGYDKHEWQQEHQPNVTGTVNAHRPARPYAKGWKT